MKHVIPAVLTGFALATVGLVHIPAQGAPITVSPRPTKTTPTKTFNRQVRPTQLKPATKYPGAQLKVDARKFDTKRTRYTVKQLANPTTRPLTTNQKVRLLQTQGLQIDRGDLKAATSLTPRNPWFNPTTNMEVFGDAYYRTRSGTTGLVSFGKYEWNDYYGGWNYVQIKFRASPNQHYLVDCIVSGGAETRLAFMINNQWLDGTGTRDGDHLSHLLRARTTMTDVSAYVYDWDAGLVLKSCEITPLS